MISRHISAAILISLLAAQFACSAMTSDPNSATTRTTKTTLVPQSEGPTCPSYEFLWNVGGIPAQNINYAQYGIQSNQVAIQNTGWVGLFPYYEFDAAGNITNTRHGGIPQVQYYADGFAAHLAQMTADLNASLPDVNFSGHIVIDFEAYSPLWSQWIDQPYRDASYAYAAAHPDLHSEITDFDLRTRTLFEEAALQMLVRSVQHVRSIRPQAKVGYYGYPLGIYWGGYESTEIVPNDHLAITLGYCPSGSTYGDCHRLENNRLAPLWQVQNGFYPSIYQFYPSVTGTPGLGQSTLERNAQYITAMLTEAKRLAAGKPVFAYTWYYYHDSTIYAFNVLNDLDIAQTMHLPDQLGIQGVILWGWAPTQGLADVLQNYLTFTMGPLIQDYAATRCTAATP